MSAAHDTPAAGTPLLDRVSRFLIAEAALLDAREYQQWLGLWSSGDITYWVPCNDDKRDPKNSLAIIYDNRKHLEERIARLSHRHAHAFRPAPKLHRVVGNVATSAQGMEIQAQCSFVLGECRRNDQRIWFGKSEYRLLDLDGRLCIAHKKVLLLNNDAAVPSLVFLP